MAVIETETVQTRRERLASYSYALAVMLISGRAAVTSAELGAAVGVNATQVRRDLSAIGRLGKRGAGYQVASLLERLRVSTRIGIYTDGANRFRLAEKAELLAKVGVLIEASSPRGHMDAAVIDIAAESAGRQVASELAGHGVGRIVNFGDYLIDAPPARVVNASPFLALVKALA